MIKLTVNEFNAMLQEKFEFLRDNIYQPSEIDNDTFAKYCYSLAFEQMTSTYILDENEIQMITMP